MKKSHLKTTGKIPSGLKLGKLKSIPLGEVLSVNVDTDKSIEGLMVGDKCYYKIIKKKKKKK